MFYRDFWTHISFEFDVIITMGRLSANWAEIIYAETRMNISLFVGGYVYVHVEKTLGSLPTISVMMVHKYRAKGCEVFFAHAVESSKKTTSLYDVEVVGECTYVFPNELLG